MTDCTHQVETLRHGLGSLTRAKTAVTSVQPSEGDWLYVRGIFTTLREHEAHEVGLSKEAHDILRKIEGKSGTTWEAIHNFEDEFVKRAVAAIVQCECQKR